MNDLHSSLSAVLAERFSANAARVRELAAPLSETQFWAKPYSYGNSFVHLVLHLTGNLNYYIGAQIANTGFIRDREREFSEQTPSSKEDTLKRLDVSVAVVMDTIRSQSPADWSKAYSAANTNCSNRLDIVMQCAAHMQHHIGQMIYLAFEWKRHSGK